MKLIYLLLILSLFIYGCASSPDKGMVSKTGEIEREWVEQGITDNYVFARGMGASDQSMDNKTQKMATSRNAAIVNAQYNMLTVIKGVELEGGIKVEKAMQTDSSIQTNINAAIKGAIVVRSEWTADDGCIVVLRISKKTLKKMGIKIKQ